MNRPRNLEISGSRFGERKRKKNDDGEIEEPSIDMSGFNYDSDEPNEMSRMEESEKNGESNSNANSTITGGDQKGRKKKGLPAKNLMRRSVVPKISKLAEPQQQHKEGKPPPQLPTLHHKTTLVVGSDGHRVL